MIDEEDRMSVESFKTAAPESADIAVNEHIYPTSSEPVNAGASNMGGEGIEESGTAAPTWNATPKPEDIHRPHPLNSGHGPAVCDLVNVETVRFPLVAQETLGNLLLCALGALVVAMTAHRRPTT